MVRRLPVDQRARPTHTVTRNSGSTRRAGYEMSVSGAIVDTDTHVVEPADLWTSRLPKKWGDEVMHVRWDDLYDAEVWSIGDKVVTKAWTAAMWGWHEPFPSAPKTLADAHPATYDLAARLDAMDAGGVRVAVLYPNIAGL